MVFQSEILNRLNRRTKNMKTLITLMAATALAFPVLSAETNKTSKVTSNAQATATVIVKEYKDLFQSGEIQLEVAGQARTEDFKNFDRSVTVGGNYYVTAGAGLHAAVGLRDLNEQFIDRVEFGLIGRVPVESLRIALLFGVGAEWQRITEYSSQSSQSSDLSEHDRSVTSGKRVDDWAVYAEAGPLFRLSKNLDFFVKVRGVRPIDGAEGEHIALIAGTALTF